MEVEVWKCIFNGYYEISNFGNVKSNKFKIPRLLKPDSSSKYYRVRINDKWHMVHRLVAENFIDNVFKKKCVNHIDENKLNNKYSNLEWLTHRENIKYSLTKRSKSKVENVHWIERMKTYQCKVYFNGKNIYLGSNKDIKEAKKIVENFLIINNVNK